MPLFLVLALAAQVGGPPAATALNAYTYSAPTTMTELDSHKLHGDIVQLSWSPDGTQLYLQTVKSDQYGNTDTRHYVLTVGEKAKARRVKAEPTWASQFWSIKSSPTSPGSSSFKIDVTVSQQTVQSTSASGGGAMATGSMTTANGNSVNDVASAIRGQQTVYVVQMRAANHSIGTWTNQRVEPGFTFGWAPASVGMLAYVDLKHDGQLMLLNAAGQTKELDGTKHVVLPAWSDDGSRLAFLQRNGKNKYRLQLIHVTAHR